MAADPPLGDFELQILHYKEQEALVQAEEEKFDTGSIRIYTEQIKVCVEVVSRESIR